MRVIEITTDRDLATSERPAPRPTGRQVAVDVAYCGVCGSDLHMLQDPEFPAASVLGHEFSGVVGEIGDTVSGVSVGDLVAVLPYDSCGTCRYCTSGRENLCLTGGHLGSVLGVDRPGGLAARIIADESAVLRLPADTSLEHGALAEPVAVAARAATRVICEHDDPVVVVGAGPIGVLVALCLEVTGFEDVRLVERNPIRCSVAESLGLRVVGSDDVPRPQLKAFDAATFVDCSGSATAIAEQIASVRRGGRVVLVGLGAPAEIDLADAILREVEVVGSAGYSRADFAHALELLASGAIPASRLITKIAAVEDARHLFAELTDPATTHVKVLLRHEESNR